jgi:GntR family transcriptional regulator
MLLGGALPRGTAVDAADLAGQLEASTDDLDRVLASAERKGLVERVSPSESTFRILGLADTDFVSVFTHTERSGLKPRSLVRQVEVQPAGDDVARCLEVPLGSPVYRYVRTRYAEEEPLANQINYMPYEVCPGLEHDDVSRYSFQKLLEGKYHTVLASAREQILLVPATEEDRQILGLPPGSSILLIDRIALSPTARPVVWATIRIRPDRIQSVAALWPEAVSACGELEPS